MANEEQVAMLKRSVEEWNQWRKDHLGITPDLEQDLEQAYFYREDLSGADLIDANLSGAVLASANLSGANLVGANLSDSILYRANLSGAHLVTANLSSAQLDGTDLSDADLVGANLSGAILVGAGLSGANLISANLSGANFTHANLTGAILSRALLNAETTLDGITLDAHTRLFGVRWNSAPLDGVDWGKAPTIGDEPDPKTHPKRSKKEQTRAYRDAARAYHGLAVALRDQGLTQDASHYRLRELAMQRKVLRTGRNIGGWLLNVVLGAVAGNGERPGRAFGAYLGIVTLFAAIYWGVTNFLHTSTPHLQWYEAIVLSLTSFHGRGFFPGTIQLGDPLAIVAALEAVSGLFIELVFIATFSRRFLGE